MGEFLRDLWQFMRVRKKFWLLPVILVLLLLGGLVVVSQQSALADAATERIHRVVIAGKYLLTRKVADLPVSSLQ